MKIASLVVVISVSAFAQAGLVPKPSVNDQIKLGKDAAKEVRKENKVLPDSDPRVQVLRQLGERMVKLIPEDERKKRPFEYTFDVIDSKEVNAFALPGGPIFFFTGLIDRMTTIDQLGGVLGHEIIHVRREHWASSYAKNMERRLGLSVILALIGANKTWYSVADIIDSGLFLLPNSRGQEAESDKFGFDLIKGAGYNPAGMADVFAVLANGGKESSDILSTHPDPAKRSRLILERIAKEKVTYPAQVRLPFDTAATKKLTQPKLLQLLKLNVEPEPAITYCSSCGH